MSVHPFYFALPIRSGWKSKMTQPLTLKSSSDVLQRWLKRSRESQLSHHLMAETLQGHHTKLGIAVIAVTAFSGATTIVAELGGTAKLCLGLLTLFAAILTSLQTFLKFEERANHHRLAGAGYGQVRRKLELANTMPYEQAETRLKEAEVELNKLAQESPSVSERVFKKALSRSEK
ncbi:SLATT domain-containing protein [Pseudomonas aeruginosa]|uniref:SLATT domain-containing protein n=1 Tax=Pseudomonas aeruginosa TaxID=287 RepID=UPI000FD29CD1|nr:SLATT domain-containing protein [Pseudomonas aeruginosa]MDV7896652.1 SLATT domain-containing protein [Pseudomonas aeruginosa]MED5087630.1 SLATT domain-containing protein [Pseudomonas aeruginosa]RUF13296.1 SLATT domain-containing protein [Pseudomonas aeruginosa]HBO2000443.1 SLATT domain-containing protein [Pseudomonas aeruginosa]HCK4685841.1 SLATT domain-containing protein [Pseudomonas aeruginosa]